MKLFFKKNWKRIVLILLTAYLIISTIYMIYAVALYKSIETVIRVLGCIALVNLLAIFIILLNKFKKKNNIKAYLIIIILLLGYASGLTFVAVKLNGIYNKIANISSNRYDNYSTSIVTRANNKADDMKDVKKNKIGILKDEEDYEFYTLAYTIIEKEKISKENLVEYDSDIDMLNDLLQGKINYIFLPTNFESRYSNQDGFEDIAKKIKIIYTKEEAKEKKKENTEEVAKSLDDPFTVLIMGVDTTNDGFSSGFNGDALILVTFNPKTTNATILSIPRDTYMPISCMKNRKNKITNAGWRGEACIANSLENYFGIDIDYHVKINFNGVVALVNAVGGVEVDVPYSFCEQNSKRQWGKNTVFVKSGKQVLNGEQALAFARHRKVTQYMYNYCGPKYTTHANYWNDFTRGQNQQIIINALIKKFKDVKSFSEVEAILDTISTNMETDMSTDNIFSLYSLGKNILKKSTNQDLAFNMQKLYLSGHDAMIYDYSFAANQGSKLTLYNYNVYDESKKLVVNAMKENLGLISVKPVRLFTFSIKNKYEEHVIGKNVTGVSSLKLMPNFVGKNISEFQSYANLNNINLIINYVDGRNGQFIGQIISQSVPYKTDLDMLNANRSVSVTVVNSLPSTGPIEEPDIDTDPDDGNTENGSDNTEDNTDTSNGNN